MEEKVYRQMIDDVFRRIDAAFEAVDPDQAESLFSQGTLTIIFKGTQRFIVSPQPPVRQIWVAFKDRAWHFDFHPAANASATGRWLDDRGQKIDLFDLIRDTTKQVSGADISISPT